MPGAAQQDELTEWADFPPLHSSMKWATINKINKETVHCTACKMERRSRQEGWEMLGQNMSVDVQLKWPKKVAWSTEVRNGAGQDYGLGIAFQEEGTAV